MGSVSPIQLAAKMEEARAAVKFLHGAEFHSRLAPVMEAVRGYMRVHGGRSELVAAKALTSPDPDKAMMNLHLIAAAVELIEPSMDAPPVTL